MKNIEYISIILVSVMMFCGCKDTSGWDNEKYKAIEDRVLSSLPEFPDRNISILDYGAVGDCPGKIMTDNFNAINNAIEECHRSGGGTVTVPVGGYLVRGPIILKSNVRLHLEENAFIYIDKKLKRRFLIGDDEHFGRVFTRFEGTWIYSVAPLIFASRQENIAITGKGAFVSDGKDWSESKFAVSLPKGYEVRKSPESGNRDVIVFSEKTDDVPADSIKDNKTLRKLGQSLAPMEKKTFDMQGWIPPQPFFQTIDCRNILIEGVSFINGGFWNINPVTSDNILIKGITIDGHRDGIDPDSCNGVIIEDVTFMNWDDNIAIKSGRDNEAFTENGGRASSGIIIRNCHFKKGYVGAVSIGSENSGGVHDVFVENCKADSVQIGLYIKSGCLRNARINNVHVRNFNIGKCERLIQIRTDYEGAYDAEKAAYPPQISDIYVTDMHTDTISTLNRESLSFIRIEGQEPAPVKNIFISNVSANGSLEQPIKIENTENFVLESARWNGRQIRKNLNNK